MRKKTLYIIAGTIMFITVFTLIAYMLVTNQVKNIYDQTEQDLKNYKYHYAMVVEDINSPFWERVYQAAKEYGKKNNVYVELMGTELMENYSTADLMRIAIASKVDGIIVNPIDENTSQLFEEAKQKKINVVTVLNDAPTQNRVSFIGTSSYQLGQEFGKQVDQLISPQTKKVMILADGNSTNKSQSIASLKEVLKGKNFDVVIQEVNNGNSFEAEESIRNIIINKQDVPDIMVCMSSVDTQCAYQAVVDYNQVGKISIIGSFYNSDILTAIEKNIIYSVVSINAKEMGEKAVSTLLEYKENGRVNEMHSIQTYIVNASNVKEYETQESNIEK